MTKSEQICNEIGAKFFCKDFVYEHLMYFNDSNFKVELCDALFESGEIYLALQIKERAQQKGAKTNDQWMNEVVYGKAVEQIKNTVNTLKNKKITISDLYHQKVEVHNKNAVFPLIVFDNPEVSEYKRSIIDDGIDISILSIEDYQSMMKVLTLPYDIFYYLHERKNWLTESKGLPNIVLGDNEHVSIVAKIQTEQDFASFFKLYIYDGNSQKMHEALRLWALINSYRDNLIKTVSQYKIILRILQDIRPDDAISFMERFDYAWKTACYNKFDYSKAIQIAIDGKKTSIVFFSLGWLPFANKRYYKILCDAKQLQHSADAILLICFVGDDKNTCQIDWVYYEKRYKEAPDALNYYENIGLFRGFDRNAYEILCKKMLNE